MTRMTRLMRTTALAGVALALAGVAAAQDAKPAGAPAAGAAATATNLRYTTGAPKGTPWVMQLERFQKDVEEEGKGSLKIDAFIAAQLGNEQDTMQQVARGRIDMGGFSSGAGAMIVPEIALLGLPFYFKSLAEQDCTLDNHMTKVVHDRLGAKGVKFLGWTEVGTADIVGKKPYVSPADVKGLKAAAAGHKVSAMMWQALGANPHHVGITELASAFQTGLVDVNATVVTFYLPAGIAKVAPVLSRVELADAPGIIVINKAKYDSLTADQRGALDRAIARRKPEQLRQEIRGFEEALRGKHVQAGGQVVNITPAQREEWRKVLEPVWPTMVKELGAEGESFYKVMEAGKKACEKRS